MKVAPSVNESAAWHRVEKFVHLSEAVGGTLAGIFAIFGFDG